VQDTEGASILAIVLPNRLVALSAETIRSKRDFIVRFTYDLIRDMW
jgi:hypothetical protein